MKKTFSNANWLIILGLLVMAGGCANVIEVAVPAKGVETGQLEQATAVFRKAEGLGASAAAPKSYQKTQQALKHMNSVIRLEPENERAIQESIERFAFEAEHLLHITQEVKELRSVQSQALENVVLSAEYRLLTISDALKQPDPRRQGLYDQTVTIANAAKKLVSSAGDSDSGSANNRRVNKNELESAYTRIKQLELQLKNAQDDNNQLKLDQKAVKRRIESLERLVLELNAKNAGLEDTIRDLKGELSSPSPPVE